jgi:hypothetical protein
MSIHKFSSTICMTDLGNSYVKTRLNIIPEKSFSFMWIKTLCAVSRKLTPCFQYSHFSQDLKVRTSWISVIKFMLRCGQRRKVIRLPGDKRIFNVSAVIAFTGRKKLPRTRRAYKSAEYWLKLVEREKVFYSLTSLEETVCVLTLPWPVSPAFAIGLHRLYVLAYSNSHKNHIRNANSA